VTERNANGWKAWLLGIAGTIIAGMAAVLFALLLRAYDHISDEHVRLFEQNVDIRARLNKLEAREER
jgi:hypothetical protein